MCCVCKDGYEAYSDAAGTTKIDPATLTSEATLTAVCNIKLCKRPDTTEYCAKKMNNKCVKCIGGYKLDITDKKCKSAAPANFYAAKA